MIKLNQNNNINILSYNAYGFKSSHNLVDNELANESDIVFICEHWLKPSELGNFKNTYKNTNCWTFIKSSVDAESVLEDRPHGGVGWICNKINNVSYRGIDIDNDRLSGVQIVAHGKNSDEYHWCLFTLS